MTFNEYRARSYIPALDGLRAFCVLGVVAAHMQDQATFGWLSGGLGVVVFFVISGYIITTLALREERARGSLSLSAFYIRRSLRIFPLYYVVLAIFCAAIALGWCNASNRATFARSLPSYLFYYQDVTFAQQVLDKDPGSPFSFSWSLGVEEKFYLVWPLLAFVIWGGRPRNRLIGTFVLFLGFSLVNVSSRWLVPPNPAAFWPSLLSNYLPIVYGCLLAQLLDRERSFNALRILGTARGALVTLVLFVFLQLVSPRAFTYGADYIQLYILGATLLIASLVTGDGWLARAMGAAPLAWVGRISYGIYLIHILAMVVARQVIRDAPGSPFRSIPSYVLSCAVAIGVAELLARVIERPCIAYGRKLSKKVIENTAKKRERELEPA